MTIKISGSDFFLSVDELREIDEDLAIDWPISGGGSADEHCEFILSQYDIECDPQDARAYLMPYGAWDEEGLEDHDENMLRLVWLIGCALGETGEAHLSTC